MNTNTVTIQNNAFNPSSLNVTAGTTVTWINRDNVTQNVVSDSGLFDSGNLTNGMSYNYTFNQTGTYPYHSSISPSTKGTIVVTSNAMSQSGNNQSTSGSGIKY